MTSILKTIAAHSRERVLHDKAIVSLEELKERCSSICRRSTFYDAIKRPGMSFICEIKKASPSKGIITEEFDYLNIAREYEAAGADCISFLTEPKWFLGSDDIFRDVRREVSIPMLRKDFTVDEYQIYQAKLMGADAVLLICALHDTRAIGRFLEICDSLSICALVEAHDEKEIASAVSAGANIIGVNNRNLNDFSVDLSNASRLRELIPTGTLFVSESGIRSADDISLLSNTGADAVLIGEPLMRAADKKAALLSLKGAI